MAETGNKGIKIRADSWYLLDITNIIEPKPLDERFINKKAALLYLERRLENNTDKYIPIKGGKLKKFQFTFADIKRRFYSKYPIPDGKIMSRQDRKTFRTTIRRKLFGYARVAPFSHKCDRCSESYPDQPTFAKLRKYLFNGRKRRICDKCDQKYRKAHPEIQEDDDSQPLSELSRK